MNIDKYSFDQNTLVDGKTRGHLEQQANNLYFEVSGRAHVRAGEASGAVQRRVPRAAHRGPTYAGSGRGRYVLRRGAEGRRQGLPADRHRLRLALCLGQAVHQQAAGARRADPEQRGAAHLRGAWGGERRRAQRQWPRVQRPRGPLDTAAVQSLRAVPALEGIGQKTTPVDRPQSNSIVERLHRTLLDEHLRVQGRTVWHETVAEMQAALDAFLLRDNRDRPHQGLCMNDRTPWQALRDGLPVRPEPEQEEPP